MEESNILDILNANYSLDFQGIELFRDGGSLSYIAFAGEERFFLRLVRPEFMKTASRSVDIHLYLSENSFSVPEIIPTRDNSPYVNSNGSLYILYEYIEGREPDLEGDIENIGELVGLFHKVMRNYPGELVARDKYFFVDRYIEILKRMDYPAHKIQLYREHGDALWERVRDLPRGYCHCDLYIGNIHKTADGRMYILDFDTSCNAFPIYDIALVCNAADYFELADGANAKVHELINRLMKGYERHLSITPREIQAFDDLLAIYHYQLQATIIEIYGLDCVDHDFLDKQFDWLMKWEKQRFA